MKRPFVISIMIALLLALAGQLAAAPSLPITKPPAGPADSFTGPPHDAAAAAGQWFKNLQTGGVESRSHEFYDNITAAGGGIASHTAIKGMVVNIVYAAGAPPSNILAFDVQATISNDAPAQGNWAAGSNSHDEYLQTTQQHQGMLVKAELVCSFAVDKDRLPAAWAPPYTDFQPYILARNHEQLAWYCWTPNSQKYPEGNYYVPAFDFGDIPAGGSVTKLLHFDVDGAGIASTDPRYVAIKDSFQTQKDMFTNRSTSLKISEWLDGVYLDPQTAYPQEGSGSDVSVFHDTPGSTDDYDWGDAPDMYPTVIGSNGARHHIAANMMLGTAIDAEPDGQPNSSATGDDNNPPAGPDDEDGVAFDTPLVPGEPATVKVVATMPGKLDAWIDFNADGSWAQPGDQVFVSIPLAAGLNTLNFTVPNTATPGTKTIARFRYSSTGGLSYTGAAPDGEVEDYEIFISQPVYKDWGDAPDGPYPTLAASSGACHTIVRGFCLGQFVDGEPDGQPDANAMGDDANPVTDPDDEDGVAFTSALVPGEPAGISVVASAPGKLDAWIDFNGNGTWTDAGEQIFLSAPLVSGGNSLTFMVPGPGVPFPVTTYARFRFSSLGGLSVTGPAPDGEVEDYLVRIEPGRGTLTFATYKSIPDHFWWSGDPDQVNEMLSFKVSADPMEPIKWDGITLQFTGGSVGDVLTADIWQDLDGDGQVDLPGDTLLASISNPFGTVPITMAAPPVIPAGGAVYGLVSYRMSPTAPHGIVYQCRVINAGGTGQLSSLPAYITGLPLTSARKISAPDPISIGAAKKLPLGSTVFLKDKELTADLAGPTWAAPWNWYYIEEPLRAAGIGVIETPASGIVGPLSIGTDVNVLGKTTLVNTAELMIYPNFVLMNPDLPTITPLGKNSKFTGGGVFGAQPGVWDKLTPTAPPVPSYGLNNIGLLIKTWGKVTGYGMVELTPGNFVSVFWIDDGAALMDGGTATTAPPGILPGPSRGIAVVVPSGMAGLPVGMYAVTGILKSVPAPAPYLLPIRLLTPRSLSDVTPYP